MGEPAFVDVLDRLIVAGVALTTRALAEATPGLDLTFPQWRVLLILGDQPGGATVSEVSARVGVTLPATSRQLRRLAHRALVTIGPDDQDRRAMRASLTDEGAAVRDRILSYRRRAIEQSVAPVRPSARALRELERVVAELDAYR